jgi:hypothetical protein
MTRIRMIAALALGLCAATPVMMKTNRERDGLKGPVKTVSMRWQANHRDEYGEIDERELGSRTYDEKGNLTEDKRITPDFIADKKVEHVNANTAIFRSVMGNSVERYVFDPHGNMIECKRWYSEKPDGLPSIIERMKYDPAGTLIESEALSGEGKLFSTTLYTNDPAGNVVIEEDRPSGREPPFPRMHYTYKFDTHGNWIAKFVRRENVPEDSYDYGYRGNLFRTIVYFEEAPASPTP